MQTKQRSRASARRYGGNVRLLVGVISFQRWSIPATWDFKVGDGNGGAKTSCYYVCRDNGTIDDGLSDGGITNGRAYASWAINDCGLLPWFIGDPLGGNSQQSIYYPTLGQLVKTIKAAGTSYNVNTPITRVHYDHINGTTTWSTDWQELDTESL